MPANLDQDGHIIITDSMPEEIKQIAARLNHEVDEPVEEEPDVLSEVDDSDEDLVDGIDEEDDEDEELYDDSDDEEIDYTAVSATEMGMPEPDVPNPADSITSDELDNLNNMFE